MKKFKIVRSFFFLCIYMYERRAIYNKGGFTMKTANERIFLLHKRGVELQRQKERRTLTILCTMSAGLLYW